MDKLTTLWQHEDVAVVAQQVLAYTTLWGEDLNTMPGLTDMLTTFLHAIQTQGMRGALSLTH